MLTKLTDNKGIMASNEQDGKKGRKSARERSVKLGAQQKQL